MFGALIFLVRIPLHQLPNLVQSVIGRMHWVLIGPTTLCLAHKLVLCVQQKGWKHGREGGSMEGKVMPLQSSPQGRLNSY